jgi:DNA (cytosine-5)-methyltransferase 1
MTEGFECVAAFDQDILAVEHHRKNLGSGATVWDLMDGWPANGNVVRPDVLLAGAPCQGFSTAGNRRLRDPRNSLLLTAGEIAIKVRPKVFLAENVTGVVAGKHKRYWQRLREILRLGGYRSIDINCDASQMGVPQHRQRMIMIAWDTKVDPSLTLPRVEGGNLRAALKRLNGANNHKITLLPSNSAMALIAKHIKPGQKLCNVRSGERSVHTWDIPRVFGRTSVSEKRVLMALLRLRRRRRIRDSGDADPVPAKALSEEIGQSVTDVLKALKSKGFVRSIDGAYDLTHTFNGKFRRLEWDRPSHTVDTRFGNPRYFLHPDENRGFTVREAARIQGFPDSFVFWGSESAQYRLVGNAVPPPVAKMLAKLIREQLI